MTCLSIFEVAENNDTSESVYGFSLTFLCTCAVYKAFVYVCIMHNNATYISKKMKEAMHTLYVFLIMLYLQS